MTVFWPRGEQERCCTSPPRVWFCSFSSPDLHFMLLLLYYYYLRLSLCRELFLAINADRASPMDLLSRRPCIRRFLQCLLTTMLLKQLHGPRAYFTPYIRLVSFNLQCLFRVWKGANTECQVMFSYRCPMVLSYQFYISCRGSKNSTQDSSCLSSGTVPLS